MEGCKLIVRHTPEMVSPKPKLVKKFIDHYLKKSPSLVHECCNQRFVYGRGYA